MSLVKFMVNLVKFIAICKSLCFGLKIFSSMLSVVKQKNKNCTNISHNTNNAFVYVFTKVSGDLWPTNPPHCSGVTRVVRPVCIVCISTPKLGGFGCMFPPPPPRKFATSETVSGGFWYHCYTLPDNHLLSLRRLEGLLRCLKENPTVCNTYHSWRSVKLLPTLM